MHQMRCMGQREPTEQVEQFKRQQRVACGTASMLFPRWPWSTPLLCRQDRHRHSTAAHLRWMRHLGTHRLHYDPCRKLHRCRRQSDYKRLVSSFSCYFYRRYSIRYLPTVFSTGRQPVFSKDSLAQSAGDAE